MKTGFLLTLLLLCTLSPLHAQTSSNLLERLRPGTLVRVLSAGQTYTGRVQRIAGDTLYLDSASIAAASIENAWLQQRATRRGLKLGAIIGAPAGAAFGAFLMTIATGLCEYECSDNPGRDIVLGTVGFGAFGLVAGGALGAVIGAALPQWVELTPDTKLPRAAHDSRRIGSLSLTPAFASFAKGDDSGGGARFAYMFQTRRFSLGPEVGRYGMGDRRVSHAGGIFRIGTGTDRTLEPFVNVGVGLYSWGIPSGGAIQLGGYSLGGGAQLRSAARRFSGFAEARWQSNLTRSGDTNPNYGFYTVGVGGAIAW